MPATQASDAAAQTTASNTQRPVTVVTEEEGDESDEGGTEEMTTGAETGNSVVDNILDQMILQGAARYVRDRTIA